MEGSLAGMHENHKYLLRPFDAPLTPRCQTMEVLMGSLYTRTHITRWREVAMLEAFIDAPQSHQQLTVFPVIAPHGPVLPYLLSTEIQDSGVLTVREKGEETTSTFLARNNSLHALLIFSGEPLPGGDRARLVERSILLGGKSVTQIPASSLERGGWVSVEKEAEITEWLESFPRHDAQVGLLAFVGDRTLGLEALGSANLYGPLHRRLLIRFIKEALSHPNVTGGDPSALEAEAQNTLDALENADRVVTKRIGLGDYRSLSGPVSCGELIYQGHLVHLSVRPSPVGATTSPGEGGGGRCF